jgi:hypothetical protein
MWISDQLFDMIERPGIYAFPYVTPSASNIATLALGTFQSTNCASKRC